MARHWPGTHIVGVAWLTMLFGSGGSCLLADELLVEGVPPDAPYAVTARAESTQLVVTIDLDPEWHAYSRDVGGGKPVLLTVDKNSVYQASGGVIAPGGHSSRSAPSDGKLTGTIEYRLPITRRLRAKAPSIEAVLELQVCDALMCLPPVSLTISGHVPPLSVLLVSIGDERGERVSEWLKSRGFRCRTVTYETLTAEDCQACDVVIADSFRIMESKLPKAVAEFPKTPTPVIAVGYAGTEIIEKHGLAMTSGYI